MDDTALLDGDEEMKIESEDQMMRIFGRDWKRVSFLYHEIYEFGKIDGNEIEGIPTDPEERAQFVSMLVAGIVLSDGDNTVDISVDLMADATEAVRLIYMLSKFASLGYIRMHDNVLDMHGFPVMEINEGFVKMMEGN